MNLKLHGGSSAQGKPQGAASAQIYRYVGETPPGELEQWEFVATVSRAKAQVTFDASAAPGSRVWLIARWVSPSQQVGPLSTPAGTYLQYGVNTQRADVSVAASSTPAMRKAA